MNEQGVAGNNLARLRMIAASLIGGAVVSVGALTFLAWNQGPYQRFEVLGYAAAFVAFTAPAAAMAFRAVSAGQAQARGNSSEADDRRSMVRQIVILALLESAAIFCGVAVLVTGLLWVAVTAIIPIAAMLFFFPWGNPR